MSIRLDAEVTRVASYVLDVPAGETFVYREDDTAMKNVWLKTDGNFVVNLSSGQQISLLSGYSSLWGVVRARKIRMVSVDVARIRAGQLRSELQKEKMND